MRRNEPVDRYCYDLQKTALYRHYDASGRLLYVGITNAVTKRLDQHVKSSSWATEIKTITIEWHESRADALDAEDSAIFDECPIYNTIGRRHDPLQSDAWTKACAETVMGVIRYWHPEPITKQVISRGIPWQDTAKFNVGRGVSHLLRTGEIRPARNKFGHAAYVANDNHNTQRIAA